MAIQPIDFRFQNDFKGRLYLLNQVGLAQMNRISLAHLQVVIFQALVEACRSGSTVLDLYGAGIFMEDVVDIGGLTGQSISTLDGFPSVDALNLIRAIVDIMETAKVD